MSKKKKRKKAIDQLITFMGHDYGAYNDIWRWNDLPPLVTGQTHEKYNPEDKSVCDFETNF